MKTIGTKLHIANGTVYLKGYTNCDLELPGHYLAKDRSDLVKQNITTIDKYYKNEVTRDDFMKGTFHKKEVVCDVFADVKHLPFEEDSLDEIVGMHIFEHFTFAEGEYLLDYWYQLLKPGGFLRLHVPDIAGIVRQWKKSGEEWSIRQIYGSQKNEYALHKSGYTKRSLKKLLKEFKYKSVKILPSINDYPAIGIRGWK